MLGESAKNTQKELAALNPEQGRSGRASRFLSSNSWSTVMTTRGQTCSPGFQERAWEPRGSGHRSSELKKEEPSYDTSPLTSVIQISPSLFFSFSFQIYEKQCHLAMKSTNSGAGLPGFVCQFCPLLANDFGQVSNFPRPVFSANDTTYLKSHLTHVAVVRSH